VVPLPGELRLPANLPSVLRGRHALPPAPQRRVQTRAADLPENEVDQHDQADRSPNPLHRRREPGPVADPEAAPDHEADDDQSNQKRDEIHGYTLAEVPLGNVPRLPSIPWMFSVT